MPAPGQKRESPASPRRIGLREKRTAALELRKTGATFQQIADQIGYTDKAQAYKSIMLALKEMTGEPAAEVLQMELDRLDTMLKGLWPAAITGDTFSVAAVLRIMERRAKYLGLDDFESRMASVAEQQVRITADQAQTVVTLLQGVLSDLGLTEAQQERAPEVIVSQMRKLALVSGQDSTG